MFQNCRDSGNVLHTFVSLFVFVPQVRVAVVQPDGGIHDSGIHVHHDHGAKIYQVTSLGRDSEAALTLTLSFSFVSLFCSTFTSSHSSRRMYAVVSCLKGSTYLTSAAPA